MRSARTFTNAPDAPAHARRYVAGLLNGVPRDITDEIAIMVSELATNCVRHTVTDFTVRVDRTASEVRVDVTDSGGGTPEVRSPELSEPSGRGLRIVEELSDAFGITQLADGPGKTVWFVVRLQDHLADRPTRAVADDAGEHPAPRPDPGRGARPRPTRSDGSRTRPEASCRCGTRRGKRGRTTQAGLPASRSRTLEYPR
jgi:serine/threonine-protein kinase RsbW